MRSPFVFIFTVMMMSGMLLASALLSFQLDKIYAQEWIEFSIIGLNCPGADLNQDSIDCPATDRPSTTTLDPPFDSNYDLSCERNNDWTSANCNLDFRSPRLGGEDWDADVSCSLIEKIGQDLVIDFCGGFLADEEHG